MMDIYSYAKHPTHEEWNTIYEMKKESLNKIQLNFENKSYSMFDFKGIEISYWVKEFNNRVFDFINCYVMMMNYYCMGIPDEEWYISPRRSGQSVQYFPHFENKHYIHLYWFGFYMDTVYSKYFSLYDNIYHIINIKHNFGIDNSSGFIGKVLKKLKEVDRELYNFLDSIRNSDTYNRISEFRNNITHNHRPNQIDSGINYKREEGKTVISMTVGNYTTTKEFVENINAGIDLMASIVDMINDKILD